MRVRVCLCVGLCLYEYLYVYCMIMCLCVWVYGGLRGWVDHVICFCKDILNISKDLYLEIAR